MDAAESIMLILILLTLDCCEHLTYMLAGKGCAKYIASNMINVGLRLRKGLSDITYAEAQARGK
jgi:hypothetical protein